MEDDPPISDWKLNWHLSQMDTPEGSNMGSKWHFNQMFEHFILQSISQWQECTML